MVVRNLNNGQTKDFFCDDIILLQSKINMNKFYRKIKKERLAVGDMDYVFSLYDNNKLMYQIELGEKKMTIIDGKNIKRLLIIVGNWAMKIFVYMRPERNC